MKLGLVLSGGGAKGAFEAGVVAALAEAGLSPTVLTGTSAGALNAAALAAGFSPERVAEVWTSLHSRDVYRPRTDIWNALAPSALWRGEGWADRLLGAVGWTWLLDPAPLRATLTETLGGETVPATAGTTAAITAVEVTSGQLVRFATDKPPPHRRDGTFAVGALTVDELLASAAIPLAFKPASVDGVAYWDGGVLANTPLASALAYEPDALIVVTTATLERPAPRPSDLSSVLTLLVDTIQAGTLRTDLRRAEEINQLVATQPQATDKKAVELLVIDPRGLDLGSALAFDPTNARRLIEMGHAQTIEAISAWRADGRLAV